jgi:Protein of unknown function (DUF1329)
MKIIKLSTMLALVVASGIVQAAVPAAQANRLGADLTPIGGEKAGNKEGTIPAWDGGITKPIAGYKPGMHHPDPFAADKPLFTITAANAAQYKAKLTAGELAMFAKYKTFAMPVYPTRRSAAFATRIYEMTKKNAVTGKLVGASDGVTDVAEGIPFPIPQNGAEVMWNHKLKSKGLASKRYNSQVTPTPTGQYTLIRIREESLGPYWKQGNTLKDINNVLTYFFQLVESPARLAGNALLVHESLNQAQTPRQAWVYNPGQRRVRKAPNVGYDNPGTASDGLRTNDMADMFNGAMDRYDWKLVGKSEFYVPYNSYKVHAGGINFNDLVKPGHLNPNYMRYELHRVWVVEATLKAGKRHINKRRTFYFDEDSWQIVAADHYDAAGALWRVSEAHTINYYEQPLLWSTVEVHHDLKSGRYIANGLDNNDPVNDFSFVTSPENFSPQALRTRGTR